MKETRITTLQCGTMSVLPYVPDITKWSPFEKRIELPVNVFLIEHPVHGKILIDTGWSEDVNSVLPKGLRDFYRPSVEPEMTARAQLEKMGIMPEDIDMVLLTHFDVDHTCALKDFAGKAKRIVCAELDYYYSCRTVC